jgi:aspartyl-tRNA(Asn)/glutamyl-tRNA(Gln) amidotransferase subunit B
LNSQGKSISESPVSAKNLAKLVMLVDEGVISGKIAKTVFEDMAQTGKSPAQIVEEKGLVQITDVSSIEEIVLKVLTENPVEVEEYKKGKTRLLGFFVGQIMKETKGKANPKLVNEILINQLN